MNIPFLNLKRQYEQIEKEVEAAVIEVMRSGAYIGGRYVADFEAAMAEYLGVKHVLGCSNGTDALMLALKACGVDSGDEVITTPFTFFATAEAIASIGAIPVFVDINEDDFNIDAAKIEDKITPKTKAIMPVHIFGYPADMDAISAIAQRHNLKVIEDAAQAIGTEYKQRKIGTTADISCFSFYPTKNLGAFGDAGMVTTNSDDLAVIIRAFKEHAMAENGAKARELLYGTKDELAYEQTGDELYNPYKYYNYLIGYNARLDAIQAAVLNIKLKYLDEYNGKRAAIAEKYSAALGEYVIVPKECDCGKSSNHQYVIKTDKKNELSEYLSSKGIGTGAFYPVPLHLQKAFTYLGYREGDMPLAEKVSGQTLCLPIFPELTTDEVIYIVEAIKEFYEVKL